jgi:hypothetical protein
MTDWNKDDFYTSEEDSSYHYNDTRFSKRDADEIRRAVQTLSSNESIGNRANAYAVLTEHIHANSLRLEDKDALSLFATLKTDLCSQNEVAVQNAFSFLLLFIPMEHGKSYAKSGVLSLVSTLVSLLGNTKRKGSAVETVHLCTQCFNIHAEILGSVVRDGFSSSNDQTRLQCVTLVWHLITDESNDNRDIDFTSLINSLVDMLNDTHLGVRKSCERALGHLRQKMRNFHIHIRNMSYPRQALVREHAIAIKRFADQIPARSSISSTRRSGRRSGKHSTQSHQEQERGIVETESKYEKVSTNRTSTVSRRPPPYSKKENPPRQSSRRGEKKSHNKDLHHKEEEEEEEEQYYSRKDHYRKSDLRRSSTSSSSSSSRNSKRRNSTSSSSSSRKKTTEEESYEESREEFSREDTVPTRRESLAYGFIPTEMFDHLSNVTNRKTHVAAVEKLRDLVNNLSKNRLMKDHDTVGSLFLFLSNLMLEYDSRVSELVLEIVGTILSRLERDSRSHINVVLPSLKRKLGDSHRSVRLSLSQSLFLYQHTQKM